MIVYFFSFIRMTLLSWDILRVELLFLEKGHRYVNVTNLLWGIWIIIGFWKLWVIQIISCKSSLPELMLWIVIVVAEEALRNSGTLYGGRKCINFTCSASHTTAKVKMIEELLYCGTSHSIGNQRFHYLLHDFTS